MLATVVVGASAVAPNEASPLSPLRLAEAPSLHAHFISVDGHCCYDGLERTVVGALAFAQAGLYGELYHEAYVHAGPCTASGGVKREHACYPGVTEHFVSETAAAAHGSNLQAARKRYAEAQKLNSAVSMRLANCSCHPESVTGRAASAIPDLCSVAALGVGSLTHVDATNGTDYELLCNQGPWQHQLAVLATMKSSPLVWLHQRDQLRPFNCASRGFPFFNGFNLPPLDSLDFGHTAMTDHCYPPSTLWSRAIINMSNPDVERTLDTEDGVMGRGEHNVSTPRYIDYILKHGSPLLPYNATPECNCLPGSGISNGTDPAAPPNVTTLCNVSAQPAYILSPIRDWWHGYDGMPGPIDSDSPQRPGLMRAMERARARLSTQQVSLSVHAESESLHRPSSLL